MLPRAKWVCSGDAGRALARIDLVSCMRDRAFSFWFCTVECSFASVEAASSTLRHTNGPEQATRVVHYANLPEHKTLLLPAVWSTC